MKIRKIAQTPGLVATVVDNLTNTSTIDALSANQGKILNDKVNTGFSYSTNETLTGGTWINGKPIYRKVIYIGSLPANTASTFSHNISNIDRVVSSSMVWFDTVDNCWWSNRRWDSTTINIAYNVTPTQIWIGARGVNWSTRTNQAYVTIEYTKTTD